MLKKYPKRFSLIALFFPKRHGVFCLQFIACLNHVCLSMKNGKTRFYLKLYKSDNCLMATKTKWKMIFHLSVVHRREYLHLRDVVFPYVYEQLPVYFKPKHKIYFKQLIRIVKAFSDILWILITGKWNFLQAQRDGEF